MTMSVVLVMVAVALFIAFRRKGSVASTRLGSRRIELTSPLDPSSVFTRLSRLAGDYRVDDASAEQNIVVLSSRPSAVSWGFFYPVVIRAAGTGSTIEVGVQSKIIQWGPVVTRAHKKCIAAIEETLTVPGARVA